MSVCLSLYLRFRVNRIIQQKVHNYVVMFALSVILYLSFPVCLPKSVTLFLLQLQNTLHNSNVYNTMSEFSFLVDLFKAFD